MTVQRIGILRKSNISYEITPITGLPTKSGSVSPFNGTTQGDYTFKEDDTGVTADKFKVSKWGTKNLFPNDLKALYKNNIVPGLMDFKVDMIVGKGLYVYREIVDEKGNIKEEPIIDTEIQDWLDAWNVDDYLLEQTTDVVWVEGIFTQYILNKARKGIAKLQHVNAEECRLTIHEKNVSKNIIVANWGASKKSEISYIPYAKLNDLSAEEILKQNISMSYLKKPSFGFRYYNYPLYIGALEAWIPLANEIPRFHLSVMQNSLNIKYHIQIPIESLDAVRKLKGYDETKLDEWLKTKLDEIDNVLSGATNAGKSFYSFTRSDMSGKELGGWQIKPIENNIKEMSEAFIKLIQESNSMLTAAFGVDPSIANIQTPGKLSSGSDKLYGYNIHINTRTYSPRRIVLQPLNTALKINWPNKYKEHIRFGLRSIVLNKQEETKTGFSETNSEIL